MTTTPPSGPFEVYRVADNEETTVLTPVSDGATALNRIPVSRQRWWIAVTALLVVLLGIAIMLLVQARNVSFAWEQQVVDVKAQNYDLGQRVADEQSQVASLKGEIDKITGQLNTAQQKISDLADDKAQQGDNVEFYARQIDSLTSALSTASNVANSLDRCIEGKNQLTGYMKEKDKYDPTEIADFEASLKIKCDNAVAANVELQRILAP